MPVSHRGNILFLLLLAIVLFAVLVAVVNSSIRGGGKNAAGESADARAARLNQWFTSLDGAVTRMMLTGGVSDYQLNFMYAGAHNTVWGSYDNSNCTQSRCRVFDPVSGGGVLKLDSTLYKKTGSTNAPGLVYRPINGRGSSASEVVIELGGVDWELCKAVNRAAFGYDDVISGADNIGAGQAYTPYDTNAPPFPVGAIPETTPAASTPAIAGTGTTYCYCYTVADPYCKTSSNLFWPRIAHIILER